MKPEILLIGPLMEVIMASLEDDYTVHRYWESDDADGLLASVAATVTAVVTDGGRGVSQAILTRLPNTKLVAVYGVGVDSVALSFCADKQISVTNTPDVLSDDVADMGVALMLAVSRQLITGDTHCRSGKWEREGAMPLTTRMSGKRAGILGMGSIGLRLAKRLEAFNMDVSYCNRSRRSDTDYRYQSDLTKMAADVDYLIVTASASPATDKIVDTDVLHHLGAEGYLINVSRGSLVDESALLSALQNGTIKGAGLDVFEHEPAIPEAFFGLQNVVLQPHNSSGTIETRQAMGQVVLGNLQAFFADEQLHTEYFIRQ